jgi:hypothetical protein
VRRFTPEVFLWIGSLNQSYHPAPLYSVKGVHDVVPVEHGQETFHRSGSVTRSWLSVFAQDAPSVLNGANDRILVGIVHGSTQLEKTRPFKLGELKSFRCHVVAGRRNDRQSRQSIRTGRYRCGLHGPACPLPMDAPAVAGPCSPPSGFTRVHRIKLTETRRD